MKLEILSPNPLALGKIAPQPWMTAPETQAVWEALTADGTEVRFIGGCVRDALLHRPIRDIDIATPDTPETVMSLLERAGIHAIPTGIDHGTVTAMVDHVPFEITTLRVDVETDGRRAKVAFTNDWIADASRRDFTINTFSCNMDGDVFDPFNGLDDLAHGLIRFVGNARERIEEDVLRLLRFFRFYATYGRPPVDEAALAACRAEAHKLPILSGERVRVEMYRILMSPNPADVVALMRGNDVLEHVLPEASRDVGPLRVMSWLDTRAIVVDSIQPHPVRRLASLISPSVKPEDVDLIAERFKMSNRHRDRLTAMAIPAFDLHPEIDDRTLRRALHHLSPNTVRDLVLLAWARERAVDPRQPHERTERWIALIDATDTWEDPAFPLYGRDAIALGIPHGPRIGRLLKTVEEWWEAEDYHPGREECLERLKAEITAES